MTQTTRLPQTLPALPLADWQDTAATLQLWTQIVGKIRLALAPMENHWWHSTLYVSARGLATAPMPYGGEFLQIEFDFIEHVLRVQTSSGETRLLPLTARSVAAFYRDLMAVLEDLRANIHIWPVPVEVEEQIPFDQDEKHAAYDPEYAHRFWRVLLQVDQVMKVFRGRYCGKASPVHFFWGSFDLAATRFSGRSGPLMQSAYHVAKYVMQEAYADECSSVGFWPGAGLGEPAFYAYQYPEPSGYPEIPVQPAAAYYHPTIKEFILPYEAVRSEPNWQALILSFFQSTYQGGANLAGWDRRRLESSFLIKPLEGE